MRSTIAAASSACSRRSVKTSLSRMIAQQKEKKLSARTSIISTFMSSRMSCSNPAGSCGINRPVSGLPMLSGTSGSG
ncbi:MAG: hypothetical protein CVT81_12450 [Alphaproteobacteria bacterium HGW-Alphaproteobacteria-3]|nr:MAG: hypothetical protein CVT81_12450 [Alphaproteobacteria bacterium HGW-Alphaproteobacteria-3]